jgi:hypothetical protein
VTQVPRHEAAPASTEAITIEIGGATGLQAAA